VTLAERLRREIAQGGPVSVARWMAACNGAYYASRDPLGAAGDFITAPEISQVFGELIGLALADCWLRAGAPERVRLVELGPGRGTLMADLLRATARVPGFAAAVSVHFVETSPVLRGEQAKRVPGAEWHDELGEVPDDAPLMLVANEFFDALPVRQFVRGPAGWRERLVGADGATVIGSLIADPLVPPVLWNAPAGSVFEVSAASTAVAAEIGARLRRHGGVAIVADYGHAGPRIGDSLQAVRAHQRADPFATPGEVDLTCHVDFTALAAATGVAAHGPVGQGAWLRALGIEARAATLKARATPEQAGGIDAAVARLTGDEAMGTLFKVMALSGTGWPAPAGFTA
jgi:NADH dehydrogenase [ubiquinone] 1 alpha subcomplex assembly factor 7